jgi:hypothetical protein
MVAETTSITFRGCPPDLDTRPQYPGAAPSRVGVSLCNRSPTGENGFERGGVAGDRYDPQATQSARLGRRERKSPALVKAPERKIQGEMEIVRDLLDYLSTFPASPMFLSQSIPLHRARAELRPFF